MIPLNIQSLKPQSVPDVIGKLFGGNVSSDSYTRKMFGANAVVSSNWSGGVTDNRLVKERIPEHRSIKTSVPGSGVALDKIWKYAVTPGSFVFSVQTFGKTPIVQYMDAKALNAFLSLQYDIAKTQYYGYIKKAGHSIVDTDFVTWKTDEFGNGNPQVDLDFDAFIAFLSEKNYVKHWFRYNSLRMIKAKGIDDDELGEGYKEAKSFDGIASWSMAMCTVHGVRHLVHAHGLCPWEGTDERATGRRKLDMDVVGFNRKAAVLVANAKYMDDICYYFSRLAGEPVRVSFGLPPACELDDCLVQAEILLTHKSNGVIWKEIGEIARGGERGDHMQKITAEMERLCKERASGSLKNRKKQRKNFEIYRGNPVMRIMDAHGTPIRVKDALRLSRIPRPGPDKIRETSGSMDLQDIDAQTKSIRMSSVIVCSV